MAGLMTWDATETNQNRSRR